MKFSLLNSLFYMRKVCVIFMCVYFSCVHITENSLYPRSSGKFLMYVLSLGLHGTPIRQVLLFAPFYR